MAHIGLAHSCYKVMMKHIHADIDVPSHTVEMDSSREIMWELHAQFYYCYS